MDRKLSNWLDAYMEYNNNTESARIFHKWVGISIIAGALRKKVGLELGRFKVYPNLYIVLVAKPGIARKSQAINIGLDLLYAIPEIVTSADAITKEALIEDIELAGTDEQMPDGSVFKHSSISIISREFESFLGQKKENSKMLVLLTDLYDSQEIPWKYRTKRSGSNIVPSLFVNLLAATTPESLSSSLPISAVGGGLTSRIIFVFAEKKESKQARPKLDQRLLDLKQALIQDLYLISRMAGTYKFTEESGKFWDKWYEDYEEGDPNRICKDTSFDGWYSRKPSNILKVAVIMSAARSNRFVLEIENILEATAAVEEIEYDMGQAFRSIGRSLVTTEVDTVISLVRARMWITEQDLMSIVWRDMDASKFDNVITTAIRTGKVQRTYIGPKGEKGSIWYRAK